MNLHMACAIALFLSVPAMTMQAFIRCPKVVSQGVRASGSVAAPSFFNGFKKYNESLREINAAAERGDGYALFFQAEIATSQNQHGLAQKLYNKAAKEAVDYETFLLWQDQKYREEQACENMVSSDN